MGKSPLVCDRLNVEFRFTERIEVVMIGVIFKPYKIDNDGVGGSTVRNFGNGETIGWYYVTFFYSFVSGNLKKLLRD